MILIGVTKSKTAEAHENSRRDINQSQVLDPIKLKVSSIFNLNSGYAAVVIAVTTGID